MANSGLIFDNYPELENSLLSRWTGEANARHGYSLELQKLSGQDSCAYCGTNLVDTFEHWLLLSSGHVIPSSVCKQWGIPYEWQESLSNLVICCSACNGFDNRYSPTWKENPDDWTVGRFKSLRERVFVERRERILKRREEEVRFYEMRSMGNPLTELQINFIDLRNYANVRR